ILWRFTFPRKGGQLIAGPGTFVIGVGRYNCDKGTYSYYGDTAAPASGGNAKRFAPVTNKITVDPTKEGRDRFKINFPDSAAARAFTYTPFLNTNTYALDWELI